MPRRHKRVPQINPIVRLRVALERQAPKRYLEKLVDDLLEFVSDFSGYFQDSIQDLCKLKQAISAGNFGFSISVVLSLYNYVVAVYNYLCGRHVGSLVCRSQGQRLIEHSLADWNTEPPNVRPPKIVKAQKVALVDYFYRPGTDFKKVYNFRREGGFAVIGPCDVLLTRDPLPNVPVLSNPVTHGKYYAFLLFPSEYRTYFFARNFFVDFGRRRRRRS